MRKVVVNTSETPPLPLKKNESMMSDFLYMYRRIVCIYKNVFDMV